MLHALMIAFKEGIFYCPFAILFESKKRYKKYVKLFQMGTFFANTKRTGNRSQITEFSPLVS
jgi:hypothetical protein